MKIHNRQSSVSNQRGIWLSLLGLSIAISCLAVLGLHTRLAQAVNEHEEKSAPPLVALLSPHDGAALNASSLHVEALIAAFKPQRNKTFVFNGQTITGRNSGQVSHVDLALDGVTVQRLDTRRDGRQMVADFQLALSTVAAGLHSVTVTAFQGEDNVPAAQSATFTVDRTLVPAQVNRIEQAATPQRFAAFAVYPGGDDQDDRDDDWQSPARLDLSGAFVPGSLSDGIDLAKDRLVVALGSHLTVLEPGKLRCQGRGDERTCRFEDSPQSLLQFIEFRQEEAKRWGFKLRGKALPPDAHTLSLRIGNDWGGIDLATGERLVSLRPTLDITHQMQALIGKGGGTVETVDQAGVLIRLEIPAGALTQDTLIKVTPLLTSPLPDSSQSLNPGVMFEPEGLQFAQPAILTIDFSNTGKTVSDKDSIFLLTSPLTTLPLFGSVDTAHRKLTALLRHFSKATAGPANSAFADLLKWANAVLASSQNLTQAEMENLLAVVAQQQKLGCTTDCIDLGQVTQKIEASVKAIVTAECSGNTAAPSLDALQRYAQLDALVQGMGGSVPALRQCERGILGALISNASTDPAAIPDDLSQFCAACDPALKQLKLLADKAQAFGFSDLQTQALQKLDEGMRKMAINLLAKVKARQGMPDEAAAKQAGIADLQAEKALVAGDDAAVLAVDVGLPAFIQQEIDSLSSNEMKVNFKSALFQSDAYAFWNFGCQIVYLDGTVANSCTRASTSPLAKDSFPPASLSAKVVGSQTQWTVFQPQPNVLAWDVAASTDMGGTSSSGSGGLVTAELTFSKPGVLKVEFNPQWTQDRAGTSFAALPVSFGVPYLVAYQLYGYPGVVSKPIGSCNISGPTTLDLYLQFSHDGNGNGLADNKDIFHGSGRLFTLTFTPK
jgi:hypothetical protein